METDIQSPCINICKLDAAGKLCLGCFRTREEIASWSQADALTKASILAAVNARTDKTG